MSDRRFTPAGTLLIAVVALVLGLTAPAMAHQAKVAATKISGHDLKPNSVTGKQIKESTLGIVPKAKTLPALKWHRIALQHGWKNISSEARPAAYAVDAQGIVHLRGAITGGTTGVTDTVVFTLPKAASPPKDDDVYLPVNSVGVVEGGYLLVSDGSVFTEANSLAAETAVTNYASLEGITFSAH